MTTQNSDFYFPDFNVPALLSSLFTRFCMVSYSMILLPQTGGSSLSHTTNS